MKWGNHRIFRILHDLGFREKLILLFVSLISIPVLIITTRSYFVSSEIIEEKTNQYSHDILYQTTKMVETRLNEIEDISFNVLINQDVQNILLASNRSKLDAYEANRVRIRMEAILSSQVLYKNAVDDIYVVSIGGEYKYELNKTKQAYELNNRHLDDIWAQAGGTVWFGGSPDNKDIVLTRLINSIQTQKPIGYLVIYVDEKYLSDLLQNTYSVKGGDIFIVDGKGSIVSDSKNELQATNSCAVTPSIDAEAYSFKRQEIEGLTQYIACSEPMKNEWRIGSTVPVSIYQKEIDGLKNSTILFSIALLIISVLCACGLSISISQPIRHLSSTIARFGNGDFSIRCREIAKDETGKLSATFNQMADNINLLVQKVFDEQQMKREAELRSLLMQIQPHFLYNTLETINWMARIHGTNDIGIIAKSLGDLMRASISGKDHVLLKEEVVNLTNYLNIQKYRYGDKFVTKVEIDPNTENLYVPKLIIQPLLENAIYHGIEPAFINGSIEVKSFFENDHLLITITDDGVGMTNETVESLLDINNIRDSPVSGTIGLKNVIMRIKTLFGNEYGVEIQSELGEGTRVTLRLPASSKYSVA